MTCWLHGTLSLWSLWLNANGTWKSSLILTPQMRLPPPLSLTAVTPYSNNIIQLRILMAGDQLCGHFLLTVADKLGSGIMKLVVPTENQNELKQWTPFQCNVLMFILVELKFYPCSEQMTRHLWKQCNTVDSYISKMVTLSLWSFSTF